MKKQIVSLALAAALMAGGALASADALQNGAPIVNIDSLKTQDAFTHDETTGAWSLIPNRTQAALDAIGNGYGRSSGDGTLFMYVSLEGNTLDNTITPTLNVCMISGTEVNAGAVSLLIDGVRYDFETASEVSAIGSYRTEMMRAPLNADGISMLRTMTDAKEFSVMLHGAERVKNYTVKVRSDNDYSTARAGMQAASADCVREALAIYDALGAGADAERAISDWEDANDKTCAYVSTEISAQPRVSLTLDKNFDVLKLGDSSKSVRELQELLRDEGYMYVDPSTSYGDQTRAAVRRAQLALSYVPTGSADAALINALKTGAQPDTGDAAKPINAAQTAEGDTAAEPGTIYEIADAARIELDSYRFAKRVTPSDGDETSAISASDSDNVLILFEGTLESLALAEKDASWDYSATLTLDGKYDYECTFAVEQNDGQSFGTALLPLSKGKFIAYAEVPAAVQTHGGAWTLTLELGDTALTYTAE